MTYLIIYKIKNNINEKVYIGLTTCTLQYRWQKHLAESKNEKNKKHLYKSIRKYGLEILRLKTGTPQRIDRSKSILLVI